MSVGGIELAIECKCLNVRLLSSNPWNVCNGVKYHYYYYNV